MSVTPIEIGPGKDWLLQGPSPDHPAVELWTVRRLPFTTDQNEGQKEMVRRVRLRLAELHVDRGQCLQGIFACDRRTGSQPDAENIVFYNFGSQSFCGATSMSFERSYRTAPIPPCPLALLAPHYHCWSFQPENTPMRTWAFVDTEPVAAWEGIPLDHATGELGLRAWMALRENAEQVVVRAELSASDTHVVRLKWRLHNPPTMNMVMVTKGLIDGSVAALQRADDLRPEVVQRLLGRNWGTNMTREALLSLVRANRPRVALPRSPFNCNGLDPCDENCVAGLVRIATEQHHGGFLDGEVWRVKSVPSDQ